MVNQKLRKFGLVCDPGGMRGVWVAGVLWGWRKWLSQADYGIGSSSGAHNLVSLLAGHNSRDFWVEVLTSRSVFDGRRLWQGKRPANPRYLAEAHLKSINLETLFSRRTKLIIPIFNIDRGQTEYHYVQRHNLEPVLVSTISYPFFSPPVFWQGKRYADGGTGDPSPIPLALSNLGINRLIVFGTHPNNYPLDIQNRFTAWVAFPRWRDKQARLAVRRRHLNYAAAKALANRPPAGTNVWQVNPEPELLKLSSFIRDKGAVKEAWWRGWSVSQERLPELRQFLAT